jgi:flagellar motor switch protein FliM
MEDILSQAEIDQLIRAALEPSNDGNDPIETLAQTTYDFRKPNKFSKEQLRGLQRIHEQFCRTYSGLMSAKLRARIDLKYQSIEQLTFGEFVRSIPNPSVLSVLKAEQLPGNLIVQISPESSFMLFDRLCGGSGKTIESSRGLSDIEIAVVKRQVITVFAKMLGDAWEEIEQIDFELDFMESNPQFLQIVSDRDVVVIVSLQFEFNQVTDFFTICIPFRTLEPIINKLNQNRLFDSLQPPDPGRLQMLKQKVRSAVLPIEVELGKTTVSTADLLTLEVGDVIQLDNGRNENVEVKIGKLTKFKGTPGKLGNKLGVVITSICEPQGDFDNE